MSEEHAPAKAAGEERSLVLPLQDRAASLTAGGAKMAAKGATSEQLQLNGTNGYRGGVSGSADLAASFPRVRRRQAP